MINTKELIEFLDKANKVGYANIFAKKIKEKDKSKTIIFKEGDWLFHDNYFGGEPYGGRGVVFFKKYPVYMMVYYGYVDKKFNNFKMAKKRTARPATRGSKSQKMTPVMQFAVVFIVVAAMFLLWYVGRTGP